MSDTLAYLRPIVPPVPHLNLSVLAKKTPNITQDTQDAQDAQDTQASDTSGELLFHPMDSSAGLPELHSDSIERERGDHLELALERGMESEIVADEDDEEDEDEDEEEDRAWEEAWQTFCEEEAVQPPGVINQGSVEHAEVEHEVMQGVSVERLGREGMEPQEVPQFQGQRQGSFKRSWSQGLKSVWSNVFGAKKLPPPPQQQIPAELEEQNEVVSVVAYAPSVTARVRGITRVPSTHCPNVLAHLQVLH
jgi:hypothetical protein